MCLCIQWYLFPLPSPTPCPYNIHPLAGKHQIQSNPPRAPILAELRTSEVTLSDQVIMSGLNFLIRKMGGLKIILRFLQALQSLWFWDQKLPAKPLCKKCPLAFSDSDSKKGSVWASLHSNSRGRAGRFGEGEQSKVTGQSHFLQGDAKEGCNFAFLNWMPWAPRMVISFLERHLLMKGFWSADKLLSKGWSWESACFWKEFQVIFKNKNPPADQLP